MTVKIKYGRNGAVKSIKGNIGRTRMNRAALELWKGNVEPTTGYKLRRFIKRLFTEMSARAEAVCAYHIVGSPQACEISFIGIEENGT